MNYIFNPNDVTINIKILKVVFMILITYITNFKLTNKKIKLGFKLVITLLVIIFFSIISGIMKYKVNFFVCLIMSILLISITYSKDNIKGSIKVTLISLSINYIVSFLSTLVAFLLFKIIKIENNYMNFIIIVIIHSILLFTILKVKKFKYGITFINNNQKNEYTDIFILNISVIILFATVVIVNSNIMGGTNMIAALITFSIIMFITIQKSLQLYYKQKLLIQELEQTKQELAEQRKENKELETENINISKKSHTLIHKQKILEYKIKEIASKTEISQEEAGEVRTKLKEIEKNLYKEKTAINLDKTGIKEIDETLEYMQSECIKSKIDFELQLKGNIFYMTNNIISKEELGTLLADHIKNAIIATKHTNNVNRSILVRLGQIDENYGLYIYDSGIEFEISTLKNLGKKPSTTHAEEGGTGMGFMNTFDTLKKCKASLIIEEYNKPNKDNYTKAIFIKFDNKNEFKIKSYRSNI